MLGFDPTPPFATKSIGPGRVAYHPRTDTPTIANAHASPALIMTSRLEAFISPPRVVKLIQIEWGLGEVLRVDGRSREFRSISTEWLRSKAVASCCEYCVSQCCADRDHANFA